MLISMNYILILLEAKPEKFICLHECTYSLPKFIIGTIVEEKFDHKQHKTVAKLTPTVNNNLYSALKVTLTKG